MTPRATCRSGWVQGVELTGENYVFEVIEGVLRCAGCRASSGAGASPPMSPLVSQINDGNWIEASDA